MTDPRDFSTPEYLTGETQAMSRPSGDGMKCGWCHYDPVRKGKKCCADHGLIVCALCKGTDSFIRAHKALANVTPPS